MGTSQAGNGYSSDVDPPPQADKQGRGSADEIIESVPNARKLDLALQIPPRHLTASSSSNGRGVPQSPTNLDANSSSRGFRRGLSFKKKMAPVGERSSLLHSDPNTAPQSPILANFMSAISWKRCTSLPVSPASNLSPSVSTQASSATYNEEPKGLKPHKGAAKPAVSRSLSVPGRSIVIVRSVSFAQRKENVQTDAADDQITPVPVDDDDQEIPEEQADCRICFDACDEGNTLKMECSCKGALRLVHERCAIKWFSMKGNKNCDVCGQEVMNLPVTLLRFPSSSQRANRPEHNAQTLHAQRISAWQDFVVLVLISTICYFFFLEQLLIPEMKTQAITIAAPCSFTLGLLSSTFAIIIAIKEYTWTYAALEFALVAMILHLFYSVLHLKALYAIALSAVSGFSIAMSINSLYVRYYTWRVQVSQNSTTNV